LATNDVCRNRGPKKHVKHLDQNKRIALLAGSIFFLDQLTKLIVLKFMGFQEVKVIIDGFFKIVHWGNTGAAWSMFYGNNDMLAIVGIVAMVVLIVTRRHFDVHRLWGQISLGLILGGITGNLLDRILPSRRHVIDFLYFYVYRRDGFEAGFPAFNVADTAICTGVGLLFLMSFRNETDKTAPIENQT